MTFYFDTVNISIEETWQALEACVDAGLTKAIGVSNFSTADLKHLLSFARIKPAANEVELHPYLTQRAMVEFCRSNDIHLTAYSSLGRGNLKVWLM
jgi:diketogulonate reductase-like aldo/keto reductase